MFSLKKRDHVLEIHFDLMEDEASYYLQFKVEKVKFNRHLFKHMSLIEYKKIIGTIVHCDIELIQNKVCLHMPRHVMESIAEGDLLRLSISSNRECVNIEKK